MQTFSLYIFYQGFVCPAFVYHRTFVRHVHPPPIKHLKRECEVEASPRMMVFRLHSRVYIATTHELSPAARMCSCGTQDICRTKTYLWTNCQTRLVSLNYLTQRILWFSSTKNLAPTPTQVGTEGEKCYSSSARRGEVVVNETGVEREALLLRA